MMLELDLIFDLLYTLFQLLSVKSIQNNLFFLSYGSAVSRDIRAFKPKPLTLHL